ncbi:MAG: hypothetical protein JWO22_4209 [Frankiales bacterium]|nr:hypothetical protein [Frankiales bacterium]
MSARRRLAQLTAAALCTGLLTAGGVAVATPALACTGDPCDAICVAFAELPATVQQKVFHTTSCPVR